MDCAGGDADVVGGFGLAERATGMHRRTLAESTGSLLQRRPGLGASSSHRSGLRPVGAASSASTASIHPIEDFFRTVRRVERRTVVVGAIEEMLVEVGIRLNILPEGLHRPREVQPRLVL